MLSPPSGRYYLMHPDDAMLNKAPMPTLDLQHAASPFDVAFQQNGCTFQLFDALSGATELTPESGSGASLYSDNVYEKDPLLRLFDQLAESDQNFQGAPNGLDNFLNNIGREDDLHTVGDSTA
jgi:hypothetical protein